MNAVGSLGFAVCLFVLVEKPAVKLKALVQRRILAAMQAGRTMPSARS